MVAAFVWPPIPAQAQNRETAQAGAQNNNDSQTKADDGQLYSPGAIPPPPVSEAPLVLAHARPNFNNINGVISFIDGVVHGAMARDHISGAMIAIIKDDEILLNKGYGTKSDGNLIDPETTRFPMGALSDIIIWTAIMQLQESGYLSLDDPINRHLPPQLQLEIDPTGPILIRHLISHSAGFESAGRPNQRRPAGEIALYSEHNAALGAAIISQITGLSIADYSDQNIFAPLDMADSHMATADALSSTANDIARLMGAFLADGQWRNGRILRHHTAQRMFEPLFQNAPFVVGMAHGLMTYSLPGGFRGLGHRSHLGQSDQGGQKRILQANLVMIPELHLGIFIAATLPGGASLVETLPPLLVDHYFASGDEPHAQVAPETAAFEAQNPDDFIGLYRPFSKPLRSVAGLLSPSDFYIEVKIPSDKEMSKTNGLLIRHPDHDGGKAQLYHPIGPALYQAEGLEAPRAFKKISRKGISRSGQMILTDETGLDPARKIGWAATPAWFLWQSLIIAGLAVISLLIACRNSARLIKTPSHKALHIGMILSSVLWLFFLTILLIAAARPILAPLMIPILGYGALLALFINLANLAMLIRLAMLSHSGRHQSFISHESFLAAIKNNGTRIFQALIIAISLIYLFTLFQWGFFPGF
jgi:CubicO group peptidase (beta-lactamase class C family)